MSRSDLGGWAPRKSFGKLKEVVPVPNLIEVQSKSFNDFAQLDYLPEERLMTGLERVLKDVFPINYDDKMSLEYVSYELGDWACTCGDFTGITNRYSWTCSSCKKSGCSRLNASHNCPSCKKKSVARYKTCTNCLSRVTIKTPMSLEECRLAGVTFHLSLKVKVQLITWDIAEGADSSTRTVRDIKEQEVFFADIPAMTDLYEIADRIKLGSNGTFLINGVERVIVSQMHRSPGVVFSVSKKVKDLHGQSYVLARIIPMRGSWIDFEFDSNDCIYVRIDKKKKLLGTTFLQALGVPREDILGLFYGFNKIYCEDGNFYQKLDQDAVGLRIEEGMLPEKLNSEFVGRRVDNELIAQLKSKKVGELNLDKSHLMGRILARDIVSPETGEILAHQGQPFSEALFIDLKKVNLNFDLVVPSGYVSRPTIATTLTNDSCFTQEEALLELHSKVWPGDSISSYKDVLQRLNDLFFSSRVYDLTKVGRIRINRKLSLTIPEDVTCLTKEDIFATVRYLVNLRERSEGELDDIDHLGNRRVRLVGELLCNQLYLGFSRIEKVAKERFRLRESHGMMMPQDLLNVKPVGAVIREFFGTGQLSQFMDQTNPLAEIAHKRRLSALGPGGVMKDRATTEVRDVHISHYGRICPIETPEGQTIGLISSLATYAMVNDLGFIETAYRVVDNGKIKDEVAFLDAFEESGQFIAQAKASDENAKKLNSDVVLARHEGNFIYCDAKKINYIDCSPKQLVSVAAALIPFLEHDDASRALMGANMQRQAVPLIKCESPIVGTGMEADVCRASGGVLMAKRSGIVEYVSAEKIIISVDEANFENPDDWVANAVDIYHLKKFRRSSYSTWIHQTPVVKQGQRVSIGDIMTSGPAIKDGELALGTNVLVAFMPWHGYNFEDAIVISKRLVSEDVLTSVNIDEYVVDARDTKLGPEEITRDIPNVSELALAGLDDDGIVRVGTRVRSGDILVGKVTLKGDVQYSPEERLLRAIFGEKSREVRDTSLRVPPGVEGTVIDVRLFSRSGIRKDRRYKDVVALEQQKIEQESTKQIELLNKMVIAKVIDLLSEQVPGKKAAANLLNKTVYDRAALQELEVEKLWTLNTKDDEINEQLARFRTDLETQISILGRLKEERIARLKKGDPLPSNVIKMVKVYVAARRSISVGDKIAGRHGNKGVISTIVPREDMPYMADGTPVDVVLNPIGVPSRMNVGQILETILGLAGRKLGQNLAAVINEKSEAAVRNLLEDYFGKEFISNFEKTNGQTGLQELAQLVAKEGVKFRTPVFDGASYENDIQPILSQLGMSTGGTYRLYDGRTSELFDQPVTVGCMYMMKLNHMVDDKLHARSVGPYSLVTQQPLGGKAQFGGQRFGEMEVWALEAYGAAYTLQELLTYKSDDVVGRHKVYETIVRGDGDEIPDPGLPESFNVLVKEFQSLGLQVDLFKTGKEEANG
jgi:DNA-directed RNA polymerase subunit beta